MAAEPRDPGRATRVRPMAWVPLVACLTWLALWYLTPGLLSDGVGGRTFADEHVALLVECVVALVVVTVLLVAHRRDNHELFACSQVGWLYVLPAGLAAVLPFHYGMPLPLALYLVWMAISVFWQDYLTFGLLQSYVRAHLPGWATIAVVAGMLWLGHAIFLPDQFGPTNPPASLAMVTIGAVLALLRARFGTLHVLLALHLSFYFLFA